MKNILFILSFLPVFGLYAQNPGTLDNTFGLNGLSVTDRFTFESISSVVSLPDGKVLAAGFSQEDNVMRMVVLRYLPDGSIDQTFGQNGAYFGLIGQHINVATAITVQPDGKILVAGYAVDDELISYQPENMFVLRLEPNGTPDNTFGNNGIVMLDYGKNERAAAIKLHPNGKIIVAGSSYVEATSSFLVYSLNSNGSLDNSFGVAGAKLLSFNQGGTGWSYCYNMAITTDGKIYLAGEALVPLNGSSFGLMRLLPDGNYDNAFSVDGKTTNGIGQYDDVAYCIAALPDGKVILGGYSVSQGGSTNFALIKYNANGGLDNSFGEFGKAVVGAGNGYGAIMDICVSTTGNILAAGTAKRNDTYFDVALAKFKPNGVIDTSFGSQGIVYTDFNGHYDGINDAQILPDGKVLVAGACVNTANSINEFLLARYWYGESTGTGIVENILASTWVYPNPNNGQPLHLEYTLLEDADVSTGLFALDGRQIGMLDKGYKKKGRQQEVFQLPADLPAGNYLLTIHAGAQQSTLKITVQH